MPVSPHRGGREFTLGMLVCEADSFDRSAALPLSAESGRPGVAGPTWEQAALGFDEVRVW
jgi:hypothetical protein